MANRLDSATSPYLLQHKDNPVDWWEWGEAAFAEAREREVPVFVSIGYAACHWCHVMAHESFEDPALAAYLNERFVPVKVDREERPDVDAVYMTATQALTGHGGWPMTVFTTPDGEPFYAGTYFPPRPRQGMPSFRQLLESVDAAWSTQRDEVAGAAARITAALSEVGPQGRRGELERAELERRAAAAVDELAVSYDAGRGGFGGAPKFPPSMVLEFLLRHHARTGDPRALAMVEGTCEAMARGGLYDQLAGGFARYSVDADWVVPHFEKMLYDNALLLSGYTTLWRDTGSQLAERVVRDTVSFLLTDLRTAEGGFASSLDADTEGHEGSTYVWTPAELVAVLGPDDGAWAAELLGVTPGGTFERGASVLQLQDEPTEAQRWQRVRSTLLSARASRPQPARDDKVVTAWNGWTVSALAWAGALFDEPGWVEAAAACADLLVSVHLDRTGRLCRASRDGVAGRPAGLLEDHAAVADGLLALHQVTGDAAWLAIAGRVLDAVLAHFRDPGTGGFFDTADDAERLVLRPQDPTDNATPSGAAAAAAALLGYAALTGSETHRDAAQESLAAVPALPARFAGAALAVGEAWLDGPREVAVVGRDDPARGALRRAVLRASAPGLVLSVGDPDAEGVPLLAGRPLVAGGAAAYVCRYFVCDAPVTTPEELVRVLERD